MSESRFSRPDTLDRFVSRLLDVSIWFLLYWFVSITDSFLFDSFAYQVGEYLSVCFAACLIVLYETISISRYGMTLGKRLVGLRVKTSTGLKMGTFRALTRSVWYLVIVGVTRLLGFYSYSLGLLFFWLVLLALLGYLFRMFLKNNSFMAPWDRLAGSMVVKKV